MEALGANLLTYVELGGLFAPVLFICFHLLRPLFFIPVVFICISGGIFFGPFAGGLYSLIGITLSSILFYGIYTKMPNAMDRIFRIKQRLLGDNKELTKSQILLLRLVPFIHFHLLSLCLIEISSSFRDYTRTSLLTNIPLAFIYTSIGGTFSTLSPYTITGLMVLLLIFLYLLRRKEIIIKWQDFFSIEQPKHTSKA
ncbi:TVP38/TMEM64 family protein [Oceanobacillus sp. AG]|uniref:TVP38/TMEM64 family protein n=1 Tax=Oceanobacillus sp. AG TaxID=2681969 RepID=UPI0012EB80CE|nr:VTT domain-containing protein [Oceanobacillus sp. AG]